MSRALAWLLSNRLLIALCALLFALLSAGALAVFYFNAVFSLARLAGLFNFTSPLPAINTIPPQLLPLMQDLSLASPGLIAFSLMCSSYAAVRLLPASDGKFAGPHFPFPESYKSYYIQIGLLGTIVGFVIAFTALEPGSRGQADILLAALGTALWSTLTAILLAYIIGPLLELVFQWWLRRRTGRGEEPDTLAVIEALRQRTVDASASLERFTRAVNTLNLEMDTLALKNRLVKSENDLRLLRGDVESLSTALQSVTQIKLDLQTRLLAVETREQENAHRFERLQRTLDERERKDAQTGQRIHDLEQALHKLLRQLRQVFD